MPNHPESADPDQIADSILSAAAEAETPQDSVSEATDPMLELKQELAKWRDAALRNQAELENFRKRMQREKAEAVKFGNFNLIMELLPVIDNFHYGLEAARSESESSSVFQGMSMVMKQVTEFLADQGVEEVPALGQSFDPNIHEAVQQDWSDSVAEGHVIAVVRKGFKLHDRLLRAANVIVSKGAEGNSPASQEEPST